jgi:hypothetical protein
MLFSHNTLLNTQLHPIIGTILAPLGVVVARFLLLAISVPDRVVVARFLLVKSCPQVIHKLLTGYPQPPWGCASAKTSKCKFLRYRVRPLYSAKPILVKCIFSGARLKCKNNLLINFAEFCIIYILIERKLT